MSGTLLALQPRIQAIPSNKWVNTDYRVCRLEPALKEKACVIDLVMCTTE